MAQIIEPGGHGGGQVRVLYECGGRVAVANGRKPNAVPMPLREHPVEEVVADLAGAFRLTESEEHRRHDLRRPTSILVRHSVDSGPHHEPTTRDDHPTAAKPQANGHV